MLAASGDDVTGELKELLKPLRDSDEEVEFAKATLDVAIQAARWDVVEIGLAPRFSDVRSVPWKPCRYGFLGLCLVRYSC
ncbi:MAG TPA: hypothetical protein VGE08_21120 [Steroidobacter sp.]|uniref:hypothetical protein n=1 Tax=Steroidobacter sp. TaxID=1978227 RepID=UPI002ED7DBAC